jgi:hypothetical protein
VSAPLLARRSSVGLSPAPGLQGTLPVWWSAADWTQLEVPAAVWAHRDLCREHHVAPDTVIAVARGMAAFADTKTGRDCRPTNDRLVERVRASLSTVQRARRVLKELGLVVEVVRGRSIMTRAERLAVWAAGSTARTIAATFALCSRPGGRRNPQPHLRSVDGDTPPKGLRVGTSLTLKSAHLRSKNRTSDEAAPRLAPTGRSERRRGGDPAARDLAEGVRRRLPWLRAVSARRLAPALTKFARASWSPVDVERGVAELLAIRGRRSVPADLVVPAAYFAALLRNLDPAERPTADDDAYEAELRARELAEATYARLRAPGGPPCSHGMPAGDVPSPVRQILACPHCRSAS